MNHFNRQIVTCQNCRKSEKETSHPCQHAFLVKFKYSLHKYCTTILTITKYAICYNLSGLQCRITSISKLISVLSLFVASSAILKNELGADEIYKYHLSVII